MHTDQTDLVINVDRQYEENDIDLVVETYFMQQLMGYYHHDGRYLLRGNFHSIDNGENYYVAITGAIDHAGTGLPYGFFLDKSFQQAPNPGRADHRRDVFDEIMPVIMNKHEARARILFPFNIFQFHWQTGEIILHKIGNDIRFSLRCHDPFGNGVFDEEVSANLILIITEVLRGSYGLTVQFLGNLQSPYFRRQAEGDGVSCGVIVADDIIKRIMGGSLDIVIPHPIGAEVLRRSQIELIRTLPDTNGGKTRFLQDNTNFVVSTSIPEVMSHRRPPSNDFSPAAPHPHSYSKNVVSMITKIKNAELKARIISAFIEKMDTNDAYVLGVKTAITEFPVILASRGIKFPRSDIKLVKQLGSIICKHTEYYFKNPEALRRIGYRLEGKKLEKLSGKALVEKRREAVCKKLFEFDALVYAMRTEDLYDIREPDEQLNKEIISLLKIMLDNYKHDLKILKDPKKTLSSFRNIIMFIRNISKDYQDLFTLDSTDHRSIWRDLKFMWKFLPGEMIKVPTHVT